MVRRHDDKLGEHYVVIAVTPRGAEKDAHKYKSSDRAQKICDALNEFCHTEL
jgi:hypothetical protein